MTLTISGSSKQENIIKLNLKRVKQTIKEKKCSRCLVYIPNFPWNRKYCSMCKKVVKTEWMQKQRSSEMGIKRQAANAKRAIMEGRRVPLATQLYRKKWLYDRWPKAGVVYLKGEPWFKG